MTESLLRLSCFVGVLSLMMVWETIVPRRSTSISKATRWFSNLSLVVIDTVLLKAVFPLAAVGAAAIAQTHGWGLFNIWRVPDWVEIAGSMLALDFIIYLQHILFHYSPILWRIHQVHHSDLEFDVTTGVRFHPLEILLSMGLKIIAVAVVGAPPVAVLAFEIVLNAASLFNHSNILLPPVLEKSVRLVLVTSDMHRIHHSVIPYETNSNFGFSLPWWDHLLGTYRPHPAKGHQAMTIGLAELQDKTIEQLPQLLMLPFRP